MDTQSQAEFSFRIIDFLIEPFDVQNKLFLTFSAYLSFEPDLTLEAVNVAHAVLVDVVVFMVHTASNVLPVVFKC